MSRRQDKARSLTRARNRAATRNRRVVTKIGSLTLVAPAWYVNRLAWDPEIRQQATTAASDYVRRFGS